MVDNSRRTFRGRGRPTDGNIPHSISQRRRARAARQARDSLGRRNDDNASPADYAAVATALTPSAGESSHGGGSNSDASDERYGDPSSKRAIVPGESDRIETCADASSSSDDDIPADLRDEIQHLRRRVSNVQESIQLSQAIVQPLNWEQNCLNAVANCVKEWRSIISFHATISRTDCSLDPTLEISRSTSREVFGLMQLAMQSGPLAGGKPGYFKRCGAEVAKLSLAFLRSDPMGGDLVVELWFTEKQADAVKKWIGNAEKAVTNDKPPSKSMLKLQQSQLKEGGKGSRKKGGSIKGGKMGKR